MPNFGVDHDVKETQKHASAAESALGHQWSGAAAADHPKDYFVPHFGDDTDIKSTQEHIVAAESRLGHQMKASFAQPANPPQDYFVPHFGPDHDIRETIVHTQAAEAKYGEWKGASFAPAPEPPRNYYVPDFGMDKDIKDSLYHTDAAEKSLGHKMSYVQAQADINLESDPICSSAGCTQYKHKKKPLGYKINYPVPNFGVDSDILDNHDSLKLAEGMKSHILEMGTEASKAKWHNPAKDVDYNFAPKLDGDIITTNKNLADTETNLNHHWALAVQLDSDLKVDSKLESDPICSSAGCTQYKHKKKDLGYKINYSVPNFGRDHDINDNFASIKTAEGMIGHQFQIGTAASKEKWANKAKDTDYDFNPALDEDVISTRSNLKLAEGQLGHSWEI